MGDQMVMECPIAILHAGVDAMGSVDPGDLSDSQLAGEVLRLRAEMDRLDAVFAGLVAVAHSRGVGSGDGYQSTAGWLRWQAGMRTADVRAAINAGPLCDVLPETTAAWRAGQITTGAMRAIAAARVEGFDTELAAFTDQPAPDADRTLAQREPTPCIGSVVSPSTPGSTRTWDR